MSEEIVKGEDDDCSICIGAVKAPLVELECKHKFHSYCIARWYKKKPTCPYCRRSCYRDFITIFQPRILAFLLIL
ncbi:hypothetical protein B4U80_14730 [Leptotrombidium deliense]|uniref:RING-type domain-containing protein n=1 Tax=Leptotrombidium deliense TaxID=299467 RepID=A0A443QZG7_9ACAR|nr:hypothetical protein B4U80_14730 [Leptotrombidium deliense]